MSKKKKIAKKNSKQAYMEKKVAIANIVASKRHVVENAVKDDINNSAETKPNTDSNLKQITVKNAEGDPDTTATILVQNQINYIPKVSVIMPVYNVEPYLRQCLDSVVNQTLKEIEIICVDDGSTDNSLEILKEYAEKDKRITIITQKNLYAGVARNAGLSQAKGEYVHFLDSDDWIDADTYDKLYHLIKEKQVPVLKFRSYTYDCKKETVVNSYFTDMGAISEGKFNNFLSFKRDCECLINVSDAPWSGIYDKVFLTKNNVLFDNLLCANDTSFFYRCIINASKIYLSSDRFVYYRINNSKSLIGIRAYHFECQTQQFFTILNIIKACDAKNIKAIRKHLIHSIFYRYKGYLNNDTLSNENKSKLKQEVKKFCKSVNRDEVDEEYKGYYDDVQYNIQLSIIIPIYNAEEYLKDCLDSICSQTIENIEIICVNDCSSDGSLKILEQYSQRDNRIKIVNNEKNTGAPGAVKNIGLKYARGNYVGFVDSDDYIDSNYFNELYNLAIKNDADISATKNILRFSELKEEEIKIDCSRDILITPVEKQELMRKSGSNWNKIYKRLFLTRHNIHCYEKRNIAEDNYFSMIAMTMANKIVLTDKVSYHYRRHENSVTSEKRGKKDFLIFEIYGLIEKQIHKICNKKEISLYLTAIRSRELQDFTWFINDCKDGDLLAFRNELKSRFPFIYEKICHEESIIISLTSYPGRIKTVHQVIESLLNQSMRADKVILWLAPEQFPNKEADLPQELLDLRERGLTIDWYHDIRSYKKLIPALRKYPEAIIVTADDDNIYHIDWLKRLYDNYKRYPEDIQAHRVTKFYCANNRFYTSAGGTSYYKGASYLNKLVGLGGVLYPPNCFYKDILNEDLIKQLAPTNDDQWFWLQAAMNGVKVRVVDNPIIEACYVEGTQEIGLTNINDNGDNLFWKDFNRIIDYYPQIKEILKKENYQNVSLYKNDSPYKKELLTWYRKTTHKILNIDSPKTFNEKIQWLKLYDATPIKTQLADKYLVRDWVKEKIGEKYLIPLLGAYNSFEEIDFDKLPNQFVIKTNHGSGTNIIVKDKSKLDLDETRMKLNRWLNENFAFKFGFELHYRDVPPKIIIEKYMDDGSGDLRDYKIMCFNGEPEFIWVDTDRHSEHKRNFFDLNWKEMDIKMCSAYGKQRDIPPPNQLNRMIEFSKKLSAEFCTARVDFYEIQDQLYFGEITFTSSSGTEDIVPASFDKYLGSLIKLPKLAYNIDTGKYYKIRKPSKLKAYLLFPYYLYKITKMKKKCVDQNAELFCNILRIYRIDIKNIGTQNNSVEISGDDVSVSDARWLTDKNGKAKIINCKNKLHTIKIKAVNDGVLQIRFRGQDKIIYGKRFPIWIDLKSVKVNHSEILPCPTSIWHDKPLKYDIPVKDGQEITIEVETIYHDYTITQLKELSLRLNIDVGSIATQNILSKIQNEQQTCEECWNGQIGNSILSKLTSYRIDIKNFGSKDNSVEVQASDGEVEEPKWFTNAQGVGKIVQGKELTTKIKVKAIKDGMLRLDFRGQEQKYLDTRLPIWVDYKSIKIDGKEILSETICTWHDKPYHYEIPVKDGQEIILDIEQKYHEYAEGEIKDILLKLWDNSEYIKKNIKTIISELAKNLSIIDDATYKKKLLEKYLRDTIEKLTSYRIDIRNKGNTNNNISVFSRNSSISDISWDMEEGLGKIIQGSSLSNKFKIITLNDGILEFRFRGIDKQIDGKRVPLWIDYKSIQIDGKEILSEPVAVWHDSSYYYKMPVKDGQEVVIEIEQQCHQYTEDELKDVVLKLCSNDEFVKINICELVENIKKNMGCCSVSTLNEFPQINMDCFVPLGIDCRPAFWMRKYDLRYCAFPFDWMMNFSLSTVLSALKRGCSDWFQKYKEDVNKKGEKTRYVLDVKSKMVSMHAFPIGKTVNEYMPEFKQIFSRRCDRLNTILKKSKNICFICSRRPETIYDFSLFLKELQKLYPNKTYTLLCIRHNKEKKSIVKYQFSENIIIYDIEEYDIPQNGENRSTNPLFWIGNEDLWNEICSGLSLSDKTKNELKHLEQREIHV